MAESRYPFSHTRTTGDLSAASPLEIGNDSLFRRWDFWALFVALVGIVLTPVIASIPIRWALIGFAILLLVVFFTESERARRRLVVSRQSNDLLRGQQETLLAQARVAELRIQELQIGLTKAKAEFLLIEELPLASLMIELDSRLHRTVNPVRLEDLVVNCKWAGAAPMWDAAVTYQLTGINVSPDQLAEIHVSAVGDNFVPLTSINAIYFDLINDPGRHRPERAALRGPDGIHKDLALELPNPGIPQYGRFSIEFAYIWPRLFHSNKNYWFLHTLDFAETTSIILEVDVGPLVGQRVQAYSISLDRTEIKNLGRILPEASNKSLYLFSKRPPELNTIYLLVIDGG